LSSGGEVQGGSFASGTANNGSRSADSLSSATGVALDASGNLYVADETTQRVLESNKTLATPTPAVTATPTPTSTATPDADCDQDRYVNGERNTDRNRNTNGHRNPNRDTKGRSRASSRFLRKNLNLAPSP
jgi:NHL repeat